MKNFGPICLTFANCQFPWCDYYLVGFKLTTCPSVKSTVELKTEVSIRDSNSTGIVIEEAKGGQIIKPSSHITETYKGRNK